MSYENEWVWSQKYRPRTIDECILPSALKKSLNEFISSGSMVNAIFSGPAGVGKTTAALAMCNELKAEYLFLQGSGEDRGIDTVKNKIMSFATKISLDGEGRKIVIYDEADNLTHDSQLALRSVIELVSRNCGFILTCNYEGRLIEPLHSRNHTFDFRIPKAETKKLFSEFGQRVVKILKTENVKIEDAEVIKEVIKKYFPDYRKILNAFQTYAKSGSIDTGMLAYVDPAQLGELMGYLKEREFGKMRTWVAQSSFAPIDVMLQIYKSLDKYVLEQSLPQAILYLADGQKDDYFSVDKQLNLVAVLTRLMADVSFR